MGYICTREISEVSMARVFELPPALPACTTPPGAIVILRSTCPPNGTFILVQVVVAVSAYTFEADRATKRATRRTTSVAIKTRDDDVWREMIFFILLVS